MASTIQDSTADSIKAHVNYHLAPADGGPPPYMEPMTAGSRRRAWDRRRVRVYDLRGHEDEFHLDKNGFQLVRNVSQEKTFDDDDRIKNVYLPETEELVKKQTGATRVHAYTQTVRKNSIQQELDAIKNASDDEMINLDSPATFVHCDQSYNGARTNLEVVLESRPDTDLAAVSENSHRWAIVNAWRPVKTIIREPLAVCDATTVAESDLRESTLRIGGEFAKRSPYVIRDQKYWEVSASPHHRWWWPSRQTPEEVLMIKIFDSKKDVARRCPHTAIQTPYDSGPPRESIEVRCLVFWENEKGKARL